MTTTETGGRHFSPEQRAGVPADAQIAAGEKKSESSFI
jgi:hypothetical protein